MTGGLPNASSTGAAAVPPRFHLPWPRQLVGPMLSLGVVGVLFVYFLPQFTSISAVWDAVKSMTWLEVASLVVAAGWNLVTFCFVMVATMPGLTSRQAEVATQTGTAVANTVPGGRAIGIALSYAMFSS